MNARKMAVWTCLAAAVLLADGAALAAITIETVPVGDPGNAPDTSSHSGNPFGQGAVSYTYNIGKYEVTAGQYCAFLNAVAGTDTYALYNTNMSNTSSGSGITRSGSSGSYTYSVDSAFVNRPVNYVSWGDAARFANWLHNNQPTGAQGLATTEDGAYYLNGATWGFLTIYREADWKWAVTSEDEWYKAAYYKGGGTNAGYWAYPTGSNSEPGRDLNDGSGNNANSWGNPYPIQSPYYTTLAGEFQNSDSPYGTFDQGGNVWEWNEAVIASSRGLRGGSFYYAYLNLKASYRSYLIFPTDEMDSVGFRVSEAPEPASMAVLALGSIAMLLRRRGLRG